MKKKNIFTVENAKVANARYSYYPFCHTGYIYDGDGIVFVTVKDVDINLKTQEVETCLEDVNGKKYVRKGKFAMYRNPSDYERGHVMETSNFEAFGLIRQCRKGLIDSQWVSIPNDSEDAEWTMGYAAVWTFENGEPKQTPVVVSRIHNGELAEGNVPDKFWSSKEKAFLYNEYKVVDEDGEEFIEQGIKKRLSLTDEQREIVNKLNAVFTEAVKAGIGFLWNRENCGDVEVYNTKDVEDLGYGVERYKNGERVCISNYDYERTNICFYDYCYDDEIMFAMKPTARQMKQWNKEHPEDAK